MKGKILDFKKVSENDMKAKGENFTDNNLSELLKKASSLRSWKNVLYEENQDSILKIDFFKMQKAIEAGISKILLEQKMIGSEFFLCGQYIAELLTRFSKEFPSSWFVTDYIEGSYSDPFKCKQAADLCFFLCSFFPGRTDFRAMSYGDYVRMGKIFYNMFFDSSKKEIGYHMSINYEPMVSVTQEAIKHV